MSGSHAPSLLTLVQRTLRDECGVAEGATIFVGVSGGADSMALLSALLLLRDKLALHLIALTVNHGLRVEAAEEVSMVQRFCELHQLECRALSLDLDKGGNLQARARQARYAALWAEVDRDSFAEERPGEGAFLATAHHKEDRAETVLQRMLRGTSLAGLGVLPARHERLLRPIIRASRRDVELHLQRHEIPYVCDPSNQDVAFQRVRVRHELLPLLKEMGPGVVEHLEALADEACSIDEPLGMKREHRKQLRQALLDDAQPIDLHLGAGLHLTRRPRGE